MKKTMTSSNGAVKLKSVNFFTTLLSTNDSFCDPGKNTKPGSLTRINHGRLPHRPDVPRRGGLGGYGGAKRTGDP